MIRQSCQLLCALLVLAASTALAQQPAALDEQFNHLKSYDFGQSRLPLTEINEAVLAAPGTPGAMQALELRLVEVLTGTASLEAKRFAARQLSIIGGSASVPALAALLGDEASVDFAAMTLVNIEGPEARQALETGAKSMQGLLQLASIQALGQRGEAGSLPVLVELAGHADSTISEAAVTSIAKVGGAPALDALEQVRAGASEALLPALRLAYLKVAADLTAARDMGTAREIYTELYKQDHPGYIRAAALAGLVETAPEQALQTVAAALRDSDAQVGHIAIGQMRGIPGVEATTQFAQMLPQAPPQTQVLLLDALAQRGDPTAREAVMALLSAEDQQVLEASIKATGKLGDADAVPVLLQLAATGAGNAPREARLALANLPAKGVDEVLLEVARGEDLQHATLALRALAERRALDTRAGVLELAKQGSPELRQEALRALQGLATGQEMPALIALLKEDAGVRRESERVLTAVLQRSQPQEQALQVLIQAYETAQETAVKASLLGVIASADAGDTTLSLLRAALKSDQADLRMASLRGLGNWKGTEPIEDLRTVAQQGAEAFEKVEALNQYLKLLRENSNAYASEDLIERYEEALALAADAQQKRRILSALGDVHSIGAFALTDQVAGDPELKGDAQLTAVRVARALSGAYPEEALAQVEPLLAATQDENLRNQAQAVKDAVQRSQGYITAWEYAGP